MRRKLTNIVVALLLVATVVGIGVAQQGNRYGRRGRYSDPRNNVPDWKIDAEFKDDVFTFVRIEYDSWGERWGRRRGGWDTDWPDSDLNFSFRLQQLTALQVNPDGKILRLTDPELFDYPFIYIVEPGRISLSSEEVTALRRYLTNGGFLMVDDFWGENEWYGFYHEIKRVFPNREPIELPLDHDIFHLVYDLDEKPQIPSIHHYWGGHRTERWDAQVPHYRGIFDDKGRMMAIICHNTDLGDGWEQEGEDPGYFEAYSEKWAYPLGINIVIYAMTH